MPTCCFEHFHRQMVVAAVADRRIEQRRLARPRQLDELAQAVRRRRRIHRQHDLVRDQARHRHHLLERIERHPRAIDMRIADEDILGAVQQRVAVGRGLGGVARQIAAGAGLVLDHDRLAETRRQSLRINPGDDVNRPARRESHHQPDRPVGIALRGRGHSQRGQQYATASACFTINFPITRANMNPTPPSDRSSGSACRISRNRS